MKIQEIKIKGFRSIKNELIIKDFGNILSLVGKNNSGKSSILNAIRLFWEDFKIDKKDFTYGGSNILNISIKFKITNKIQLFNLSLCTDGNQKKLIKVLKDTFPTLNSLSDEGVLNKIKKLDLQDDEKDTLVDKFIELLKIEIDGDNNILIKFEGELNGDEVKTKYIKDSLEEDKNYFSKKLGRPNLLFIGDDRNFNEEENSGKGSLTAQLIQDLDIKKESITLPASTSLISINDIEKLVEKKFGEKTKEIGNKISENFKKFYRDDFDEINLNPTYSGISHSNFKINAQIKDSVTGNFIDLNNLGAGLRSIYILSLLKAFNEIKKGNNTIIIIEEPELYLHPELQKEMSGTLNDIGKEHTVFFTTHSPLLLNKLNIENIRNISFNTLNKTTESKDADIDIICNDLGYNTLDILNKEKILFVEGTSDIEVFSQIINKFYRGVRDKVKIVGIGGCSNLPKYATLNFIGESPMLLDNSLIILDRDYQPTTATVNTEINRKTNFKIELKKIIPSTIVDKYNDDIIYITQGHSLECLFLDFGIINSIFPGMHLDEPMIRREFRGFCNNGLYFQKQLSRIKKIPNFFENIENGTLDIKHIRGHNLMHYLIFKCYGEDYSKITTDNEKNFCKQYIDKSNESHFHGLLDFFNGIELFNSNKSY